MRKHGRIGRLNRELEELPDDATHAERRRRPRLNPSGGRGAPRLRQDDALKPTFWPPTCRTALFAGDLAKYFPPSLLRQFSR
jgi:hypothetical protein